ncbi:MAG: hypothetical protein ABIN58_05275 [candidate division WOR-3 bacterium]
MVDEGLEARVGNLERITYRHEDRINGLNSEVAQLGPMLKFLCDELGKISEKLSELPCRDEIYRMTRLETRVDTTVSVVRWVLGGGGVIGIGLALLTLFRHLGVIR